MLSKYQVRGDYKLLFLEMTLFPSSTYLRMMRDHTQKMVETKPTGNETFLLTNSAHDLHTKNLTKTKYQKAYTTKQINIHNCTIFTSMWSGIHVMSVTTVLWLCSIDDTAQYLRMGDWSKLDSSSKPGFWNLRQHSVRIRILTDMINIWDQLHTVSIQFASLGILRTRD